MVLTRVVILAFDGLKSGIDSSIEKFGATTLEQEAKTRCLVAEKVVYTEKQGITEVLRYYEQLRCCTGASEIANN